MEQSNEPQRPRLVRISAVTVVFLVVLLAMAFHYLAGCGQPQRECDKQPTMASTPAPVPVPRVAPPVPVPVPVPPTPTQGCGKVAFTDIMPVLQTNCTSCHAAITQLAVAQSWALEMSRRVGLPTSDNDHMPKGTAPQLSNTQIQLIQKWVSDGANADCSAALKASPFLSQDYLATAMIKDASALPNTDRPFTRYIITAHAIDAGLRGPALAVWQQALNKGLNGLNAVTQDIFNIQQIEPLAGVWRWDVRSYGLNLYDIQAIEAADVNINIVDNTTKGIVLQQLLGTKKPWLHADNLLDLTYRNSQLYYKLLKIPPSLKDFQAYIGVDFGKNLKDLDANFLGSQSSPIAEQKNRLLVRVVESRSQDAYYWQTFDVNNVPNNVQVHGQIENTKNLFQFPLLYGTGGVALFTPDASEVIYGLPNGLQGYALFDGMNNRLDFADPNVVIDTQTPLGNRTINNANSCVRCHNMGLLAMQDQILQSVLTNAAQFLANDVQIVRRLYQASAFDQALFNKDNQFFAKALKKTGNDPLKADPMSVVTDRYLQNWDENQVASLLFLSKKDFELALNTSAIAKAQIGQLLTGGTVAFAQLVSVLQQLISDARLFQDPKGE